MNKRIVIVLLIVLGICISTSYSLYKYYSEPSLRQSYILTSKVLSDTINIAYIGDSWAFLHQDHSCQISSIIEERLHYPTKVYSYGLNGFTSKEIYESIFDNDAFKNFLQMRKYQYCYISAGINDANLKMSPIYYKHSMECLIQFLLDNNIRPIIQEIPDYDIRGTYYRQRFVKKLFLRFSSFLTGSPIDCLSPFRDEMDNIIEKKEYSNKVSVIKHKSWNYNHELDWNSLYKEDRMHLNARGYAVLDSVIALEIIRTYNSNYE